MPVVKRKTLAIQVLASPPHIDINQTESATAPMQVEISYPLFFRYITRRATHSSQVGTMPATYQSWARNALKLKPEITFDFPLTQHTGERP
jgi:hypothetical protein